MPNPAEHAPTPQLVPSQEAVPLVTEQLTPHDPQLAVVLVEASQPSRLLPLQFPKPGLHEPISQVPAEQVAVALGRLQLIPQPPQFEVEKMFTSQPSAADPLQSAHPAMQLPMAHEPPEVHMPLAWGGAHAVPHPPQSVVVVSERSQPLDRRPSQLPQPGLQVAMAQVPVLQVVEALAAVHVTPQPPQWAVELSGVSQPLASTVSQLPKPGLQKSIRQAPVSQVGDALLRVQTEPHTPQLASEVSGASQPSRSDRLQLPHKGSHEATAHVPVAQVGVE